MKMWPSVRAGEKKWIFPFQKEADIAFNSALDYELAVLKPFVEPLLAEVKPDHPQYGEARRLQEFLRSFLAFRPTWSRPPRSCASSSARAASGTGPHSAGRWRRGHGGRPAECPAGRMDFRARHRTPRLPVRGRRVCVVPVR
jgi:hypothetical protein